MNHETDDIVVSKSKYHFFHYRSGMAASFYPPSQKATGENPWMNARRVTLRSLGEGGYASAGFAELGEDATAVKPWSFTVITTAIQLKVRRTMRYEH